MDNKKKKLKPNNIPTWWDCTWHRIPCGRDDCPLCGQMKKEEKENKNRNKDPHGVEAKLEEMNERLDETLDMVEDEMQAEGVDMKEIEAGGADGPPDPDFFPLHQKVGSWCQDIYRIAEENDDWLATEAGKDLIWYTNILMTRTYHQLCNRWDMKNNEDGPAEDYDYNKYVLAECIDILTDSLKGLEKEDPVHQNQLRLALLFLNNFKREVINI